MKPPRYTFFLWRTATLLSVSILSLAVLAALSGILIGFNYQPAAGLAHESLQRIASDLPSGTLILGLHQWAGNVIIIAGLIQIIVMFLGRRPRLSWFSGWVSGFATTATAIALGWTAMILNWDQLGFWRLKVELSTLGTVPILGNLINTILLDDGSINSTALTHFYGIHSYVLPLAVITFAAIHLVSHVVHERQEKKLVIQQLEQLMETKESSEPTEAKSVVASSSSVQ